MREASQETLYVRNLPADLNIDEMYDRVRQAGFKLSKKKIANVRYKLRAKLKRVNKISVRATSPTTTTSPTTPTSPTNRKSDLELRRMILKYGTDHTRQVLQQLEP